MSSGAQQATNYKKVSLVPGRSKRKLFFLLTLSLLLTFLSSAISPMTTANAAPADVVSTWKDSKGNSITLRQGTYNTKTGLGFAWTKVKTRHGIKKDKVFKIYYK
ncbi:MAG: hypothetical protein ACTHZ5_04430 [Micrococcaceae bacterium]